MDRMFASVALGCTAKPETCASAWTGSGTPLSVCAPKGVFVRFKIGKLALAVGKQWGGIAPTPPGVNVRPLMWPGELINSECSPDCGSSLGPDLRSGWLPIYPLRSSICRVVFPWSIPTLGFFIQIVGESAKFIGNFRCA
jgi:hypothetical protein